MWRKYLGNCYRTLGASLLAKPRKTFWYVYKHIIEANSVETLTLERHLKSVHRYAEKRKERLGVKKSIQIHVKEKSRKKKKRERKKT